MVVRLMVYPVGVAAAVALGVGYVLQQRVAATMPRSELLHFRLLLDLMHRPMWWAGTCLIIVGQCLSALALLFGGVAIVEPLLSLSLLVAFVVAARGKRHAPRWQEILGALLLTTALAVFLANSPPTPDHRLRATLVATIAGVSATIALASILVAIARRRAPAREAVLLAAAAGVIYGLQDVATRATLIDLDGRGALATFVSPWPYFVLAAGVFGVLLTQSAFGAARLDYSLPPATATEPVVAIALGAGLLGEQLPTSVLSLTLDALCLVALVVSVVLIGRSPALSVTVPPVRVGEPLGR
jgi:drug/metabolite transporter (DMT)-like permease